MTLLLESSDGARVSERLRGASGRCVNGASVEGRRGRSLNFPLRGGGWSNCPDSCGPRIGVRKLCLRTSELCRTMGSMGPSSSRPLLLASSSWRTTLMLPSIFIIPRCFMAVGRGLPLPPSPARGEAAVMPGNSTDVLRFFMVLVVGDPRCATRISARLEKFGQFCPKGVASKRVTVITLLLWLPRGRYGRKRKRSQSHPIPIYRPHALHPFHNRQLGCRYENTTQRTIVPSFSTSSRALTGF